MNIVRQNIIGATTILSLVVFSILLSHFLSSKNILISSAFLCIFFGLIVGNIFSLKKIFPHTLYHVQKLFGYYLLGFGIKSQKNI